MYIFDNENIPSWFEMSPNDEFEIKIFACGIGELVV